MSNLQLTTLGVSSPCSGSVSWKPFIILPFQTVPSGLTNVGSTFRIGSTLHKNVVSIMGRKSNLVIHKLWSTHHGRCSSFSHFGWCHGVIHVLMCTLRQGITEQMVQLLLDWIDNAAYFPDWISWNGCLVGIPQTMVLGSVRILGSA